MGGRRRGRHTVHARRRGELERYWFTDPGQVYGCLLHQESHGMGSWVEWSGSEVRTEVATDYVESPAYYFSLIVGSPNRIHVCRTSTSVVATFAARTASPIRT